MDIQTRKINFIQEFLQLQSEDVLARLEQLLHSGKASKSNNTQPMSVQELQERIAQSMEDSKKERLTPTSTLITEIEKWA